MRIARKLFLLTAMALTAMAFAASSASAQETPIEVTAEGGSHCNPCVVTATGSSNLRAHVFGIEFQVSACTDSFTANINENGTGTITGVSLTGSGCNVVNCQAPESVWPISASGETGANVGHMTVRFCVSLNGEDPVHCNVEVQVAETASHVYRFSVNDWTCPSAELTGSWTTTTSAANDIEINHL